MQGGTVPIVLWEITTECEKALDLYEAYPKLYVKEEVEVITKDGAIRAMVYVMSKQYEQLSAKPSDYYINTIWQGYLDNKLPLIKLREAISEVNCFN